jgi:hypothetical protein
LLPVGASAEPPAPIFGGSGPGDDFRGARERNRNSEKAMPGLAFDRLRAFPIVSTRVALGVHRSNPLRKLPLHGIERVLAGEVKSWKARF